MEGGVPTPEGVLFTTDAEATRFADRHGMDVVQLHEGWLATHRKTWPPPMPTREGDIVMRQAHPRYDVWLVEIDGEQRPDESTRKTYWETADAEQIVRAFAEAGGRIFVLRSDGRWRERRLYEHA